MSAHQNIDYINSPFKFLDAYELKDSKVFFGRKKETDALYEMVYKTKLMLIYGESGTGKTSLIQCGLASRFEGPDWLPFFIRRRGNINTSLHDTLNTHLEQENEKTNKLIEKIDSLNNKYFRPVYLIFDQFEELFILGNEAEQLKFIQEIKQLIDAKLACKVIFVMREEYIGHLYEFEKIIPTIFDYRLRIEEMDRRAVKEVIEQSFKEFNIQVRDGEAYLIDRMIDNISRKEARIELPYLQIYLDRIYRDHYLKRYEGLKYLVLPPIVIEEALIKKIGNIDAVLEDFLLKSRDNLQVSLLSKYPSLSPNFVHDLLNEFVTEDGTKQPIKYSINAELMVLDKKLKKVFPNVSDEIFTKAIEILKENRIIRDIDYSLELAHDSLANLIEEQRTDEQKIRNTVSQKLKNTYALHDKTGEFLTPEDLILIKQNLKETQIKEFKNFIEQSESYHEDIRKKEQLEKENQQKREIENAELAKRNKIEKKKSGQIRKWASIASVFAILTTILAVFAFDNAEKAEFSAKEADKQKDIALNEKRKADSVSIQLAKEKMTGEFKTAEFNKSWGFYQQALEILKQIKGDTISNTIISPPRIVERYKSNWKILYNKTAMAEKSTDLIIAYNLYIAAHQVDTIKPYEEVVSNASDNSSDEEKDWLKEKIISTQDGVIRNIVLKIRQARTWKNNCECNLSYEAIVDAKKLTNKLNVNYLSTSDKSLLNIFVNDDLNNAIGNLSVCIKNCN